MTDGPSLLLDLKGGLAELPGGVWPEHTRQAFLVRIDCPGQNPGELPYGVLGAEISPRRPWDKEESEYAGVIKELSAEICTDIDEGESACLPLCLLGERSEEYDR